MKQKMSLKDRLSSIKAAFSGTPNQSLLSMARALAPLYGEPPRRSSEEWLKMYHETPRLNNPVHQIASDCGTASFGIYDKNDIKKIKILNHPVEQLLKNPNPNPTISAYTLFYLIQVYLLLPGGESFIVKERNNLGKVTELWPIPSPWVQSIPSVSKPYYSIYPQGNMQAGIIQVIPEDMIYFKDPDVSNPYLRGIGRSNALGDDIETEEQMVKFSKRFFYNSAIPSMVGMMPGADEAVINRTEEQWSQKYGGTHNAHKTAFLSWDAKFQVLKETNKDLEFIEARRYIRDESHQFFNIPPELMGILESSNRSTISAAYFIYSKNVLLKRLKFVADVLNTQLIPDFDKNVYIEYQNIVPEDEEFNLKKSTEGLKYGALSVNQWLRTNGFEELGDKGEVIYVPLNMVPVSLNEESIPAVIPATPIVTASETIPPTKDVKKKLTLQMKDQIWHIMDKAAVKNERYFINALKKYFQSQQDRINSKLLKSTKAVDDIDWEAENKAFYDALRPLWMASLGVGFETVNEQFGFGISFDVMNPKFLKWVKENGLDRVTDINSTTKDKLRITLSDGIEAGEGIPKLRDRISEVYADAKGYRATLIARTETITTVNAGSLDTYRTAKIKRKEWLSQIDDRTREAHEKINGEIKDIDEVFSNGEMYPNEPNCRCTILPVLE
jgi:HK97 family phage portal protein